MEPEPNRRDGSSRPIAIRIGDPGSARAWRVIPAHGVGDREVEGGTRRARAAARAGWFVAGVVVFTGGLLIWHLLFGATVGGDVWLGHLAIARAGALAQSAWVA